jgi:hypothetical protein
LNENARLLKSFGTESHKGWKGWSSTELLSHLKSCWIYEDAILWIVLAIIVVLYHGPVLWGGGTYVFVDDSRFFYPLLKWGSDVWGSGHLPLWNTGMDCGTPYWGDPQTACAYVPLWLLYAFLAPVTAFNFSIVLHQMMAVLCFAVFARGRGLSLPASFAGALVFGFSLHVTCSSWTPPALFALSWIPWIFWAGEAWVAGKRWAFPVVSGALGLQMAAGYPVLVYLTGFALWAHLAIRPGSFTKDRLNWIPRLLAAYVLAVLYNLCWGLPFLDFFPFTNHGSGGEYYQTLHWDDLWSLLVPFPKGNPVSGGYFGVHFWVATYYMGWAVPFLLLWRVVRRRGEWGMVILAAVALWLSLGETAGLGSWLKHILPGYVLVIRSGFLIGLVVFFSALLAAEALEDLSSLPKRHPVVVGWGAAVVVAVSLLPAAWAVRFSMPRSYYEKPPVALALMTQAGRMLHSPRLLETSSRLDGPTITAAYEIPKDRLYPNWSLAWGRPCAVGYNTIGLERIRQWREGVFKVSPFLSRSALDYLGVRYLVGTNRFAGLVPVGDAGGVPLSLNPSAGPPWFCAQKVYPAGKQEEDWKIMDSKREGFGQMTFAENVSWSGGAAQRTVEVLHAFPGFWELKIGPGTRALLVSSEAVAAGWKVSVDGEKRTPLLVNHAFAGVELLPGDRRVRWVYAPGSLRLGLFLALLALGMWSASLGMLCRGTRRPLERETLGEK